jgi:hypothetical protein
MPFIKFRGLLICRHSASESVILGKMKVVHTLTSYFFQNHFSNLPSTPRSYKWSLQICLSYVSCLLHASPITNSLMWLLQDLANSSHDAPCYAVFFILLLFPHCSYTARHTNAFQGLPVSGFWNCILKHLVEVLWSVQSINIHEHHRHKKDACPEFQCMNAVLVENVTSDHGASLIGTASCPHRPV